MAPKFQSGDIVIRRNQPESLGFVREIAWDDQTEEWTYRVQFGNGLTALVESSLCRFQESQTVWDRLGEGQVSGIEHFRHTLTYHKLKSPTSRVAYAFSTARTLFFPHQFKPLLKFLDNGGRGLLIADDVGLGKTIEAGYILRELQARRNIERVLIMVPARLGIKWKREMRQRFEEEFEIVKAKDILRLAEHIAVGGELPTFKWIISYESARPREVRHAMIEAQPSIDLFIADEAHRLRNTSTLQHKVGRVLCDLSAMPIFLTATPVQNRIEDLWNLLRLLSPDEFPNVEIFKDQVRANRLIVESQRLLSSRPPETALAFDCLDGFAANGHLGAPVSESFLASILDRLREKELSSEDLAELVSDIAQLNILGHVISRTRKSEAMPDCAQREAMWNKVDLTEPERRIYDSVEELCRFGSRDSGSSSWGFQMATMMAFRATASCIPAAVEYFHERLESKERELGESLESYFEAEEFLDDFGSTATKAFEAASGLFQEKRAFLSELVEYWQREGNSDSKLDTLLTAIREIWEEDDRNGAAKRKIVIFSFFRKTLEYLRRSLEEEGFGLRMIHGLISLDDRESAIEDFLTRENVRILLTSEVGGEGIDLQQASVLFNYDLPWNPMVVEQRIGRLDRIGQQADKIVIVNFIVGDSIEERILQRLLTKIGIFETTIGEIDPIIGDQIESLTRQALSGDLTPDQLEKKIHREERAIENRKVDARKVQAQADNLFTSDQSLLDEIKALTGERQIPTELDLLSFLNKFLGEKYPGSQIRDGAASHVVRTTLSQGLASAMEQAAPELGSDIAQFGRRVSYGAIDLTVSREVGYRHIGAELIHINHPLVRFVIGELGNRFQSEAFCLSMDKSEILLDGLYGFLISMIEMKGKDTRNRMAIAIADLEGTTVWLDKHETVSILAEIVERGRSASHSEFPEFNLKALEQSMVGGVDSIRKGLDERDRNLAETRSQQRKAISVRLAEMNLQKAETRLFELQDSGAKDFAIRMATSKLAKAQQELDTTLKYFNEPMVAGVEAWTDVAVGLLRIGGDNNV